MRSAEIRRRFLGYFAGRGHTVVPSASLLLDDPTLLFVNAGMVPFKPYFLGDAAAPFRRATSVQKVIRTQDIEEVGVTSRHGTFFQMNGNFSFGDYFKEQAIGYAWELSTAPVESGGFGLDPDRIWPTVYLDDDEAFGMWRAVGVPAERIQRRGQADNMWSMGIPGPAGTCSELFYDRGPRHGREGGPEADEDRYMEYWNLVFMAYERGPGLTKDDWEFVGPLPARNIDTGMGMERIATLLQGVDNLYEIDEVRPVLDRAEQLSGRTYGGGDAETDRRLRVVADHVRSSMMLVADGVAPGNEGRGYVLRRLLRRVIQSMRLLGVEDRLMDELLPVSRAAMAPSYPELDRDWERISSIVYAEEDAFRATLRAGTAVFDTAVTRVRSAGGLVLPGDQAFALHDTYGFPIDLTLEMAAGAGLAVDEAGFRRLMTGQRQRAKADARTKKTGHVDVSVYRGIADALSGPVVFTGYEAVTGQAPVAALLVDGVPVESAPAGTAVEVVLPQTPFYAESGGQLADTGTIATADARVEVGDVQRPVPGLVVHRGVVAAGTITRGSAASLEVDVVRRRSVSRAHTATHLVHQALRDTLGPTATQAGSENAPGRLRFDFSWNAGVSADILAAVEAEVNGRVQDDLAVTADVMPLADAKALGAMALFGERYPEQVRVVSVSDWSRELCGGTHALSSAQLGLVTLLSESSIGSGVRRVEALVGADAYGFLAREHALVSQLSTSLRARPDELADRVSSLVTRLADAERDLRGTRSRQALAVAPQLAREAGDVYGVAVVAHAAPEGTRSEDLRALALDVRARLGEDRPAVVAVAAVEAGRPAVVVAVNRVGRDWGLRAGDLVKVAAAPLGGRGGGKPDLAQGGGTDPARVADALRALEHGVGAVVTGTG